MASEMEVAAATSPPDTSALQKLVSTADEAVNQARAALVAAEQRAAEERRSLVERRETIEELKSLAHIALRHLDQRCPVCGQVHDIQATTDRLEALIGTGDEPTQAAVPAATSEIAALLESREKELLSLQSELAATSVVQRQFESAAADRHSRLTKLAVTDLAPSTAQSLRGEVHRLDQQLRWLSNLQTRGEALALTIARAGESARRIELEKQLTATRGQLRELRSTLQKRARTGDLAQVVIDQLRSAGSSVVSSQLESMQPLLQRIYGRVDPHPTLRSVRWLSSFTRGHGQLATEVSDSEVPEVAVSPGTVLSSSQSNALAVSIFLTLNMGLPSIPLSAALLDDPLQSLDDVNLLGLIDLLKRTKDRRQLIISTHDHRFGQLLVRKLRPIDMTQRTRVIEFKNWDRSGPAVEQSDVATQRGALLVVA